MQSQNEQISFELKDNQLKSIEASRQSSSGKLNIKTAVRAAPPRGSTASTSRATRRSRPSTRDLEPAKG